MNNRILTTALFLVLLTTSLVSASDLFQDTSLPLYRDAFEKMLNGAFGEAIANFETLISTYPESSRADDAAYYIGYCLEKLGDLPKAFSQYKNVLTAYQNSISARKAEKNAVDLARRLRTSKDDQYSKFLETVFKRDNAHYARLTAMRMAEFGDWRGIDLLIESLNEGSVVEQIRSAELLARKSDNKKVNEALRQALLTNSNSVVRINALKGLYPHSHITEVRSALVDVLLNDKSELLRSAAARSLGRYIDTDAEVRKAFENSLRNESQQMVLQPVIVISLQSKNAETIREEMIERLKTDQDPMVQYLFSSVLDDELKLDENLKLVENLINNPQPLIRINAMRTLSTRLEEPEIKGLFVEKLKNDPDSQVRSIALNVLKEDAANDGEVREAVVKILRESDDTNLVTVSIHVVQHQVQQPRVREELMSVLIRSEQPVVAGQATYALLPEIHQEEVQNVIFSRLEQSNSFDVKYAVSSVLSSVSKEYSDVIVRKLKPLFLQEKNNQLAISYLNAIQRLDPKTAAELRKQRKISGYTYEFTVKKSRGKN